MSKCQGCHNFTFNHFLIWHPYYHLVFHTLKIEVEAKPLLYSYAVFILCRLFCKKPKCKKRKNNVWLLMVAIKTCIYLFIFFFAILNRIKVRRGSVSLYWIQRVHYCQDRKAKIFFEKKKVNRKKKKLIQMKYQITFSILGLQSLLQNCNIAFTIVLLLYYVFLFCKKITLWDTLL